MLRWKGLGLEVSWEGRRTRGWQRRPRIEDAEALKQAAWRGRRQSLRERGAETSDAETTLPTHSAS